MHGKVLKEKALQQLHGRWGNAIAFYVVLYSFIFLSAVLTDLVSYYKLDIWVYSALIAVFFLSSSMATLRYVSKNEPFKIRNVFKGFNYFLKAFMAYTWQTIWVFIWALLFVVPGIIKYVAYSQMFFIIADNPEIGVRKAMKTSIKMMDGYKWDYFTLLISFTGWFILSILTFGIGFLWLVPYCNITFGHLYIDLKAQSLESGVCSLDDFSYNPEA